MPPKGWKKAEQNPSINVEGKKVELMENGQTSAGRTRWKGQVYLEGVGTVFINIYSKEGKSDHNKPTGEQSIDVKSAILEVLTDLANRRK